MMDIKFKTDGIRGVVQKELNPLIYFYIGCYLGSKSEYILVGRDTRESGKLYLNSLICGITSCGCDVYNVGITTTPSVAILTRHYSANFGVMITASHNPYNYNGIKIFNSFGSKIDKNIKDDINNIINSKSYQPTYKSRIGKIYDKEFTLIDIYLKEIFEEFDLFNIKNQRFLLDGANGGGSNLIFALFKGFEIEAITIGNKPDGKNINDGVGSLHLENKKSLLKKHNCDYGFALDGDGDRLLGITTDYLLDGDIISYLLIKYNPTKYLTGVVSTPLANRKIVDMIKALNIPYYESEVGDQNVYELMKIHDCNLGFEKSGHVLFKDHPCDGLYTLCNFLKILDEHGEDIKNELHSLALYPSKMINITLTDKTKKIISDHKESILNLLKDKAYLYIRESGTENLLRIYMEARLEKNLKVAEDFILEKVRKCAE